VLILNRDSDFVYALEHSQKPLFNLLGTPAEHKRHVIYPGGHGLGHVRHQLIEETLDWLDKYLGPV
jgi:hypothetical protein